ncbi:alcohol dehydrogenase catalytic domain-containing protein [Streptomyces sp. NEAU-H3]|uniref:alcohol dehydrogenase catalytic domain-containing protein n=1 Tax=Streptomyces sp. NEAU-H3 TaxID=2720636 RepID=UPI0014390268|nr:alcohol dehydrogenase catalytic domain-containing protein [Streptomyces sp. NEAU-H3]NJA56233.1 alcohol dehydrogenase catalytic domain-containing protein [Streptomyces sp. NEAU-H3]
MKAAVIPEVNAPWEIREVATPRPGPGQVLLKVHACGLCHNDLWTAQGVFPFPSCDPAITGHEAAGEVVEVGPGTTSRQVGDRVGTTWVQATCGRCSSCRGNPPLTGSSGMTCAAPVMTGLNVQGGHAEYLCVAAASTVLRALRASEPQPHERIAVLGIGGLGHMALQYARASGLETVALTRSPDKHALAAKLGADLVVRDGEELREAGGADVVLVTGTSYEAATDALRGLRVGGRVVLATIDPVGSFRIGPNAPTFWARGQRVLGASHDGLGYLPEALDLVARGDVTPMTEVFPMERITDAVDKAARGEVRFRAVVTY